MLFLGAPQAIAPPGKDKGGPPPESCPEQPPHLGREEALLIRRSTQGIPPSGQAAQARWGLDSDREEPKANYNVINCPSQRFSGDA